MNGRLRRVCPADELKSDILDLPVEFDGLDVFIDALLDPTKPLSERFRVKFDPLARRSAILLPSTVSTLHRSVRRARGGPAVFA